MPPIPASRAPVPKSSMPTAAAVIAMTVQAGSMPVQKRIARGGPQRREENHALSRMTIESFATSDGWKPMPYCDGPNCSHRRAPLRTMPIPGMKTIASSTSVARNSTIDGCISRPRRHRQIPYGTCETAIITISPPRMKMS
jgi:hypothetical protein